jgi:hypothetical protein
MMKSFFLFIILITSIKALNLDPVKISEVIGQEFNFDAQKMETSEIVSVIQQNFESHELKEINSNMIKTMGQEIFLTLGMIETQIHHLNWELTITPHVGTLKIYRITAEIEGTKIKIIGKYIQLEQDIPSMFDTKEHCERSGRRKYGIAGPRKMKCHTYQVPRGLNQQEIDLVTSNLITASVKANKKLIGY